MSHVATVQAIYEAFGRGDIPAILEKLSEDVAWDQWAGGSPAANAGIPYLVPHTGREDVGEFFAALGGLEFHAFEPTGFLEGGNQVAAVIRLEVTQKSTGKRIEDEEVHLWTFNDAGQVVSFRHFLDTAKHLVGAPVA
jgi:ketosteroid isomerase-like protein